MREVSIRFGGILALDKVTFDVDPGSIVGLIGPNGAGKTTMFNLISGLYKLDSGDLVFDGATLLGTQPYAVVRRGIARTFQNVELWPRMTVLDNVLTGYHSRYRTGGLHPLQAALGLPGTRRLERDARDRCLKLLAYLGLEDIAERPVRGLPFATLKLIELARGLASEPKLLLLDEPAGGLNHEEVERLAGLIKRVHKDNELTLLLVEHHMNLVMRVSDRNVVLDFGRKIAEGTPEETRNNPRVIEAYLGTQNGAA